MPSAQRMIQLTASLGLVGGLTMVGAAAGGASGMSQSIASDSPAQILSIAKTAATRAGSFTVVCNGAAASVGLTGTAVTNVGTASGSQYTKDKVKGIGTATVATRMVGGVAYFKGNAAFLEIQFGVKHSKYANEWISVSKGQKDFAVISAGMTMSSALLEIAPVRPLSKSKVETFAGKSVVAVIGKVSPEEYVGTGTQHTYVGVAAPNRPVGISLNSIESGAHFHGTCTFSNWKHKFVVTKPSGATPITKTNL